MPADGPLLKAPVTVALYISVSIDGLVTNAAVVRSSGYPILDTETLVNRGVGIELAAAAFLEGGAGILQFRHKGHWSREVFAIAQGVARLCREAGAPLIVNDRSDFALLLEAGLHVGQDDLLPRDARKLLGPDACIGYSSHNVPQLCAAGGEPVDYVALGPIFSTGLVPAERTVAAPSESSCASAAAIWLRPRCARTRTGLPAMPSRRCRRPARPLAGARARTSQ